VAGYPTLFGIRSVNLRYVFSDRRSSRDFAVKIGRGDCRSAVRTGFSGIGRRLTATEDYGREHIMIPGWARVSRVAMTLGHIGLCEKTGAATREETNHARRVPTPEGIPWASCRTIAVQLRSQSDRGATLSVGKFTATPDSRKLIQSNSPPTRETSQFATDRRESGKRN